MSTFYLERFWVKFWISTRDFKKNWLKVLQTTIATVSCRKGSWPKEIQKYVSSILAKSFLRLQSSSFHHGKTFTSSFHERFLISKKLSMGIFFDPDSVENLWYFGSKLPSPFDYAMSTLAN